MESQYFPLNFVRNPKPLHKIKSLKKFEDTKEILLMWVICINIYYTKIKTEKSKNIYLKNNYILS